MKLRPIKPTAKDMRLTFEQYNYVMLSRHKCYCPECGEYLGTEKELLTKTYSEYGAEKLLHKLHKCPRCKTKLKDSAIKHYKSLQKLICLLIQTQKDTVIFRRFMIYRQIHAGNPADYQIWGEVSQEWITKKTYKAIERKLIMFPNWSDNPYQIDDKMIKRQELRFNGFMHYRDVSKTKLSLQICHYYFDLNWETKDIALKLNNGGMFETLIKLHREDLVKQITITDMKKYHNIIRVLIKHKYLDKVKEWWDYKDYIKQLEYFKKDTHSPHYLCPADFNTEHKRLSNKIYDIQRKERQKREEELIRIREEKDRQDQAEFYKRIKKYKPILLHIPNNMLIKPIMSIEEMQEEGHKMHHCVGSYWKNTNSLILVCRTEQDERVATIEVNLKSKTIIQIRAACNADSPYKDEITKALNLNMNYILHPKKNYKQITD